jgi:predicted O-linked N-acetylglucosamine transferase (SPINDLY family)
MSGQAIMQTLSRAVAAHQAGNLSQAEFLYKAVLEQDKRQFDAMHLLGVLEGQRGRLVEAERLMGQSLKISASRPEAHGNYARILNQLKRHRDALAAAERALALSPNFVDAHVHRGNALQHLDRPQEALASFDRALALKPDNVQAMVNRSLALLRLDRAAEAASAIEQALRLRPGFSPALVAQGNVLMSLGRPAEALAAFEQALRAEPRSVDALFGRGSALADLRRHGEAVESYSAALALDPNSSYLRGQRAHQAALFAAWNDLEADVQSIRDGLAAGSKVVAPFPLLALSGTAAEQLRCARVFSADRHPAASQPLWRGERSPHDRIRVGYVSADFREHAVSHLIAGMLERHDRLRFEAFGFALNADHADPMGQRIQGAFEHFIPAAQRSDREIASLMREQEIDIAIDLMGFTQNARTGVFALRPAPIQVNYLGFPATMGADFIDYIVADPFLIPEETASSYSEKIVRLPETFQANDMSRPTAERLPSRQELGLPEGAFVFCAFNGAHKIMPTMFDVWMRLVSAVEGSVLWLIESNDRVAANLKREAASRGVDGSRLVFARPAPYADYLARYSLADLFLDTAPFNGGTTSSDVLWSGLPMVALVGEAFAARMSGSLLTTVGLPELATNSLAEYKALALALARDPERLGRIRAQLQTARAKSPLFNADRFCRHMEAAFAAMWARHQRGEPPADIAIPRID